MFAWIVRFIEHHPELHRVLLSMWRSFPPRLAGFLKGLLARKWVIGAVAVMIDEKTSPPEILLVEHSYRPRGAWGLPGGSLESAPGDPVRGGHEPLPDNVVESALQQEVYEELGIGITVIRLLRIDAIPYVAEEPGPFRLDFYFRCAPRDGFSLLRQGLSSEQIKPRSPEIKQIRFVPLTELKKFDLYSTDFRFLLEDLPRIEPTLTILRNNGI
ncbi:MAG TPA: NUDIX hydrolase [Nitrospiria bacterium]|jgi:8-oxo-dGTP pyrophosphatase MutT (NUDIX family)